MREREMAAGWQSVHDAMPPVGTVVEVCDEARPAEIQQAQWDGAYWLDPSGSPPSGFVTLVPITHWRLEPER
jgi:hypothetical protein